MKNNFKVKQERGLRLRRIHDINSLAGIKLICRLLTLDSLWGVCMREYYVKDSPLALFTQLYWILLFGMTSGCLKNLLSITGLQSPPALSTLKYLTSSKKANWQLSEPALHEIWHLITQIQISLVPD